jgi:DNA-binding MarR family transcriptional regulator
MSSSDSFNDTFRKWIGIFMHHSMRAFIHFSKENGLSMSQIGAMFHIRHGSAGVSDIGDDLGVTSAAASQMLERLVQQGLVVRSEDPHDRRVKQMILTDEGNRILLGVVQARMSWTEDLARKMTPAEKEQVLGALNILIERTYQLDNEPN